MKLWKCGVCGYLHEGDTAPDKCPRCGAGKEQFAEVAADAVVKIDRSRLSNSLHGELMALAENLEQVAEAGIEDNLDPTCMTIFQYAREQAVILRQLGKAEIAAHVSKEKWG